MRKLGHCIQQCCWTFQKKKRECIKYQQRSKTMPRQVMCRREPIVYSGIFSLARASRAITLILESPCAAYKAFYSRVSTTGPSSVPKSSSDSVSSDHCTTMLLTYFLKSRHRRHHAQRKDSSRDRGYVSIVRSYNSHCIETPSDSCKQPS